MKRTGDTGTPQRVIHAVRSSVHAVGVVTAIMVIGILASGAAAMLLQTRHEKDHELVFTRDASALTAATQIETTASFSRINDLASFMTVAGVPTQGEFQQYLREADLLGARWLERIAFIEPVTQEDLDAFVARERRQSGQRVELRLNDPTADEFYLLSRTASPFERLIGIDLRNVPGFRSSLGSIGQTTEPRYAQLSQVDAQAINLLTGVPDLVSSSSDVLAGVIPLRGGPSDIHLGWLLVQIRTSEIVSAATQTRLGAQMELLNARHPDDEVILAIAGGRADEIPAGSFEQTFTGARLQWRLSVWSTDSAGLSSAALAVLVLGIIGSLAVGLLVALQRKARHVRDELHRSEQDRRTDGLTGLPNRIGLSEALNRALAEPTSTAVLFCDIDRFKVINDSLGHQAGDELLCAVAARLRVSVREGDVVGRFGGDEFVIICSGLADSSAAERLAERILESVSAPLKIAGTEVEVGSSIGIALSTAEERRTADGLLRDADVAMYAAKKTRGGHRLFDGALHKNAVDRLEIERALRATLKDDLLRLEYQPIVAAGSHKLVAVEALARFDEPLLAATGPKRVIPIAEEVGLVGALGEKVLREACGQMARWNELRQDAPPLQLSVNVAHSQLRDPDFSGAVRRALHESGLPPNQLVLELPESAIAGNMQFAVNVLKTLSETGAEIAIDDFGSGRSSLTDIIRLTSIAELKIDRSLVSGTAAPSVRGLLISAVAEIARGLDARLVAVGVETQEQLASVKSAGAERAQGFLFSHPKKPEELEEIVADPDRRIRPKLHSEAQHRAFSALGF